MIHIFIIDMGHRKDTLGKNANGLYEYEFNEDVGRRLEKKLSKHGEVYFTIESDTHPYSELTASGRTQNLNYRTTRANNIYWNAVKKYNKGNFKIVFISIHANAFDNPSVSGYEIFVYKHGSEAHNLAKAVHRQAQLELGVGSSINDRGIKEANFYVLRNTIMPAILVEHEFYTNPKAVEKLKNPVFREKCADHLCKGVLDYMGIKYDNTPTGGESVIYRVRKEWLDSKSQKGAFGNLEYAINKVLEVGNEYKVFDENGKQVYPDNVHWAKKHYNSLIDKGIKVTDTNFDKSITLGNAYKLFDELTDDINTHDELEDEVEKEPEKEIEVVEILQLEYKRALQHKMKGEDVRKLQIALIELGYDPKGIDGSFGNGCLTAVKKFQRDNGLIVDGSFGLASHNKINELLRRKANNQPMPNPQIRDEILRPDRQTTIVRIPFDIIDEVDVAVADTSNGRMTMAQFQNKFNFDFSINLALFWNHNGVSKPLNLLIDEYKQIYEGVYSRFGLRTFKDKSFDFDWYKWSPDLKDMIGGSPSLIINGKKHIDTGSMSGSLITARHPRSAIGSDEKNLYLVTVDGRNASKGHYGMTINELANLGLELGLTSFMNNDGGGSVRMLKGTQVLNSPTENRAVQSILGIKLK